MIRRTCLALGVALLAVASVSSRAEDKKKVAEIESIDLFNGKNFEGWRFFVDPKAKDADPKETWSVEKGVIICKGKPNGYIITEKEYENYILELEWKWGDKAGNSGVFVHVSGPDKIWPKGAEAQLMAGRAGDFWLVDSFKLKVDASRKDEKIDRHFFRVKTDKPVEKETGEWNKYRITCKGDSIKLEINGQVVNEGTDAEASKGKIILQSEGAEIHFRNIKLTPIK